MTGGRWVLCLFVVGGADACVVVFVVRADGDDNDDLYCRSCWCCCSDYCLLN